MKILIVTPYFYPAIGGVESYVLNIAKGLKNNHGHEVVVVTSNHKERKYKIETIQGLKVHRLPYWFKLSNTPVNPNWYFKLRKIFKLEKPDIINAHTPVPYMADMAIRAARKTPVVLTYHNDLVKSGGIGKYLAKAYYVLYMNKSLNLSDRIIATSEFYVKSSPYLAKYQNKIDIVTPGYDENIYNTRVDKSWLKKQYPNKNIILFVGNMDKTHAHKGIDVLIQALVEVKVRVPNIHLLAVGKGDAINDYISLAKKLGVADSVSFPGFVKDEELPKYYAGANVLVLPSTTASEGFGMVIIEAAACGTPAVGSNIGGIPYSIKDGYTGLLCTPKDPNNLAERLLTILNEKKLSIYGKNAYLRAHNKFTWDKLIQKTNNVFLKVRKYSIVHITPYYPPHLGGMENSVSNIAFLSAKQGIDTYVITSNLGSDINKSVEVVNNLTVHRLKSSELFHTPIIWGLFINLFRAPKGAIFHIHIAQALSPEIALLVAKIKRLKVVAHIHADVEPSGKFGFILPLYKKYVLKIVLHNSDAIILPTESYSKILMQKYRLSYKPVSIPSGVDDYYFTNKNLRSDRKKLYLLYVGRLSVEKNIPLIIEAARAAEISINLNIIGEGPLFNEINRIVKNNNDDNVKITLHNRMNKDELLKQYLLADALVVASDYESQSIVATEAIATGTPIIGFNIPGLRDTVGSAGVLVASNVKSLTNAINQFGNNESLRHALSISARERSEEYRWYKVMHKIMKVYDNL